MYVCLAYYKIHLSRVVVVVVAPLLTPSLIQLYKFRITYYSISNTLRSSRGFSENLYKIKYVHVHACTCTHNNCTTPLKRVYPLHTLTHTHTYTL